MQLKNFAAGVQLLYPYYDEPTECYCLGAEHDQFHMYATTRPLRAEDVSTMRDLGWFQPNAPETDEGDSGPYDEDEGWSCFV